MMNFSISNGAFYPSAMMSLYGDNWPADAVEVDIENERKIRAALTRGDYIKYANSEWQFSSAPPKDSAAILAQAVIDIRQKRTPIINALDGIAGRTSRAGDMVTSRAADEAINALLDITELPALLNATTYEQMQAAVTARYNELSATSPALVKQALEQYRAN